MIADVPSIVYNGTNRLTPLKSVEDQKPPMHLPSSSSPASMAASLPAPAPASVVPRAKAVKYPIEDLALDPTSIFDGRLLRSKTSELPPLPKKPLPQGSLPVPQELFDLFITCWNFLNVFGYIAARPNKSDSFWLTQVSFQRIGKHCRSRRLHLTISQMH